MRCNITIIFFACMTCMAAADRIVSQRRHGDHIIVTYESGAVKTNALFLSTSPAVAQEMRRRREDAEMANSLREVILDTRTNIAETAELSDMQIAGLYIAQMRKPVQPLIAAAATNTIEYAIGAGMRQDLIKEKK
jgi:hypothetical protein